ncbi:MAG: DinB family protein [Chloroflexota bacterium]|jgi:hypothetical protein|nr:DinB family protein [Chloroflexota bacterium]
MRAKGMGMNRFENLAGRMRAAHGSWQMAVEDLTLEHVNHHERPGVLPIAFSLMHLVNTEDVRSSERLDGGEPIWVSGGWEDKVGVNVPAVFRGTPMEVAESLRFRDVDAWREYQTAVFAKTIDLLTRTEDGRWDEIYADAVPGAMSRGFLALLCGDGPVTLGNYLEVVLYHHSLRHLGELEHARALVGLGGVGG